MEDAKSEKTHRKEKKEKHKDKKDKKDKKEKKDRREQEKMPPVVEVPEPAPATPDHDVVAASSSVPEKQVLNAEALAALNRATTCDLATGPPKDAAGPEKQKISDHNKVLRRKHLNAFSRSLKSQSPKYDWIKSEFAS